MTDTPQYDKLRAEIEGSTVQHWHDEGGLTCDFCSERIRPNREIRLYLADRILNPDHGTSGLSVLTTYGPCCPRRVLLFPHQGTTELLLSATVTTDLTIADVDVMDVSPSDRGEPWNPVEVWNELAPLSFAENARHAKRMKGHAVLMGPEDVANALLDMGIDVREVVDAEGNVSTDAEKRRKWDQAMEETAKEKVQDWKDNGTPW